MTIEETIETISQLKDLKRDCESIYNNDYKADMQACDNAIAALEKQIPKKPETLRKIIQQVTSELCCPTCGKPVVNSCSQKNNPTRCMMCGQALDWSEYNN